MRVMIDAIPTKPGGGLTVLLGLLRGWRQIGAPLDLCVLVAHDETESELRATGAVDRLVRVAVGAGAARAFLWQNYNLGRLAAQERAEVVIGNNHYLFNLPCPQVVHHHNLWRFITPDLDVAPVPGMTNRIRDWNARVALRRATANVFVSEFLRHQAEQFEPESKLRNHVVRNGLDDELIDRARLARTAFDGRPQLVAIQSANPHKDNETMVRTLAELVRLAPSVPWHLKVAGSAGRGGWSSVQQLASDLAVGDRITWCGFCHVPQLDQMLRESVCLLATSVLEAGPLPVIEAMARGCVPVASRIPSNVEFVGDAGLLVEPRNPTAFAAAVWEVYSRPEYRAALVAKGSERIEQFRWSRCAAHFQKILELATGQRDRIEAD